MNSLIAVHIFTLAVIPSVFTFSWEDCGLSTNPIKLQDLRVTNKNNIFYVSMRSKVAENITEPIEAKLDVKKKVPFTDFYIDVPCVDGVGSCEYTDICELSPWKTGSCPNVFVQNNLPCRCPIVQNQYAVKQLPVDLRAIPIEIRGTYKVKLVVNKGTEELFCVKIKITI